MARPDLDDGWVKIAHELLAALFVADFSKRCLIVLREVFDQAYGPAKARKIWLDPLDIAQRSGLRRENVWHAIRDLIDDRVLERLEDGSFRFVKDYERWLRGGSLRLSKAGRLYAKAAPERAAVTPRGACLSRHAEEGDGVSIETRASVYRDTRGGGAPVSIETRAGSLQEERAPAHPAASERSETENEEAAAAAPPGQIAAAAASINGSVSPEQVRTLDELVDFADHLLPGKGFGETLRENVTDLSTTLGCDWRYAAAAMLKAKHSSNTIRNLYRYVISTAKILRAEGRLESDPIALDPAPRTKPAPADDGGAGRRAAREAEARDRARLVDRRARWERLTESERESIRSAMRAENPGLGRWQGMLEALCLDEMARRLSEE